MSGLVREKLNWPVPQAMVTKIYNETYSDNEIHGLLTFYKTPWGRVSSARLPR